MHHLHRLALRARRVSERAAGVVEYTLLVALIALALVAAATFLGDTTDGSLDRAGSSLAAT